VALCDIYFFIFISEEGSIANFTKQSGFHIRKARLSKSEKIVFRVKVHTG
jgi:hypothetical protein